MKQVFVASPIGARNSSQRNRSDKLLRHVIIPVCRELDFEVIRADKLRRPGRITDQVTEYLQSATIVVADLTGLNPNVMFELGVRSGRQRPFILFAKQGQQLPFDLKDLRTIFYSLTLDGAEAAKTELKEQIKTVLASSDQHGAGQPEDTTAGSALSTDEDFELATKSIENHLMRLKKRRGLTRVGFDGVRRWVNRTYSDKLLYNVLHRFPDRLRFVELKNGKPGIALANE